MMNIYEKLVEVRKSIGGFTKDSKSFGYTYVSGSQVLFKIKDKMNELGVLLIPEVLNQSFEKHEYVNAKGKDCLDFLVYGHMNYKWVNANQPDDFITVPFYYTGAQDDISKAFGSAFSYSERYFILKFFNLPTDADDPDARDTTGNSAKNNNYNNQQNYNRQQNYNNNQTRTQTSQNAPQSNLISDAQIKMLKTKLGIVSKKHGADMIVVYNGALQKCNIQPTETKDLTKQQASTIINYLQTLE